MSLDDLRARMHAHAKTLHELDLDEAALDVQRADLAARREAAVTEAGEIATALQNYQPTVPPKPTAPVEYALYCYNDPAIDGKWAYQTLQGQTETIRRLQQLRAAGVKKLYRYSHCITWTDHPDAAVRGGFDPATFDRAWLATYNDRLIRSTKFDSGDGHGNYLIDVGIPAYRQASAQWLIDVCRTQGWDGIYLDEINEFTRYAGYRLPSNYSTEYRFQLAQLAYIQHVAAAVKAAGFECHVNIASNPSAWRNNVTTAVDGNHIEFFLVQWTVTDPGAWHIASLENGEFRRQLDWVVWNEKAGKTTTCQADARSEAQVEYALASLLLVTTGKARFAATRGGYSLGAGWWTSAMRTAQLLGQPKAPYTVTEQGLYRREFELGWVTVNPSEKPINTMPATTGRIELR